MAELADALVLGTSGVTRGGSTPSIRTTYHSNLPLGGICFEPELQSNARFKANLRVHGKPFFFALRCSYSGRAAKEGKALEKLHRKAST